MASRMPYKELEVIILELINPFDFDGVDMLTFANQVTRSNILTT